MKILILLGIGVTLTALTAVLWVIRFVLRARKQKDEEVLKAALRKAMLLNMVALFASALGLSMVIIGILLG